MLTSSTVAKFLLLQAEILNDVQETLVARIASELSVELFSLLSGRALSQCNSGRVLRRELAIDKL